SKAVSFHEAVAALIEEAKGILWHQRLNHANRRKFSDAHKHVDGIPSLKHPYDCQGCPVCFETKPKRTSTGNGKITQDIHSVGTGLSADWGFVVQKSKNKTRLRQLEGENGEQAFLIVADHFSGMLYGMAAGSKAPPLLWLNRLLTELTPRNEKGKYVTMDQGGEMAKNGEVRKLMGRHKYAIRPTAPGASHQNAPAERPIQTFGNAMRAMLHGADLKMKYWTYAFYHFLRIHNLTPRAGQTQSPYEKVTGKRPNLKNLRTFGCRVWVRPPGRRSTRRENHTIKGIFLGYTVTMSQIYYLDNATTRVKTTIHATFDEGMNDLDKPTPNARILHQALGRPMPKGEQEQRAPSELNVIVQDSPFLVLKDVTVPVICDCDNLDLILKDCEQRERGYLSDVEKGSSSASGIRNWRRTLVGAYIVQVNDTAVYTS
ncbi:MAG: DDE-type integrase/transposase/recombinase, partial [Chloroflexi bacterium]|nr:DDE-type integrase/transposase/recombinase [Chloroflexota bacterium]